MKNVLIFVKNYEIQFEGLGSTDLIKHENITTDLETFLSSSVPTKIAIVEHDYNPGLWSLKNIRQILDQVSHVDLVIFRSVEGGDNVYELMNEYDHSNFVFVVGLIRRYPLNNAKEILDGYWLKSTANFYLDNNGLYTVPMSWGRKPKCFEVLYGVKKPHRTFIKQMLGDDERFLQSKFLDVGSCDNNCVDTNADDIFWEDNIRKCDSDTSLVEYRGHQMKPSQVMPLKVYSQTAYSLICETMYSGLSAFPTEKVAKPMIAGRPFVVVSCAGYLEALRRVGFKTFDGIIDESYDTIENHEERWKHALEACYKLCELDQEEVLARCRPIMLHNREQLIKMQMPYFDLERYLLDFIARRAF